MAKKNLTKKEVMNGAKKAKGTPNKLNIKDTKLKKKPKALAYCRISTRSKIEHIIFECLRNKNHATYLARNTLPTTTYPYTHIQQYIVGIMNKNT